MKILVDKLPEHPIECAFNDVHYDLDEQSGYHIPHFMCKLTGNYSIHPCELTRDDKVCPYLAEIPNDEDGGYVRSTWDENPDDLP